MHRQHGLLNGVQLARGVFPCRFLLCLGLMFAGIGACGGKSDPRSKGQVVSEQPVCERMELGGQASKRWPQGTPFYLPYLRAAAAQGDTPCPVLEWELVTQPQNSRLVPGKLKVDAAGISRLVPDEPGEYVLRRMAPSGSQSSEFNESSDSFQVTVVSLTDVPFHNYNYTTSQGLAEAEGFIWVADPINGLVQGVNPNSGQVTRNVVVGGWPVSLAAAKSAGSGSGPELLYVIQKASDSLAVIDPREGRLVDANFVGDEPSDLVIDPSGQKAYVSLASDGQIAIVNLATLEVEARVDAVRDARYLTLNRDGSLLAVASFRSGTSVRYPYPDAAATTQKDLVIIDVKSQSVVRSFGDIGTTLQGLVFSPDDSQLLLSRLINDTKTPLAAPGNQSFRYEVAALDVLTGDVKTSRSFQARPEVAGDLPLVAPTGLALEPARGAGQGALWVVFEASDVAVRLALPDLSETERLVVPGRPRSALAALGRIWFHGPQGFELSDKAEGTEAGGGAAPELRTLKLTQLDARGELLARGQSYFTGVGQTYAKGWSCNSCHVEGVTDTLVWNAGPVKDTHVSKPFFWLEGTAPLGWQGYMSSVRNYSYEVHSNIGIRATDPNVAALQAYMRSLTVPPPANSLTERDGALSAKGLEGQEIFNGKGRCASCHVMPLGTNNLTFNPSSTEDKADVPSVVGSYRHGVWLKHGEATTLAAAIDNMATYAGADLTQAEKASLERYLKELTGRDFFLLSVTPDSVKMPGSAVTDQDVPVDVASSFELVFSLPVLGSAQNLDLVRLVDSDGQRVPVRASLVSPRMIRVELNEGTLLAPSTRYRIVLGSGFESYDERPLIGRSDVSFVTAATPVVRFDGAYTMRFYAPRLVFSPDGNRFDPTNPMPIDVPLQAVPTPSGADITLDFKAQLSFPVRAVISGSSLYIPPTPVPAGPASFVDGFSGYWSAFSDDNGDGIGDRASGRFTYSGPGFMIEGLKWELVRNP